VSSIDCRHPCIAEVPNFKYSPSPSVECFVVTGVDRKRWRRVAIAGEWGALGARSGERALSVAADAVERSAMKNNDPSKRNPRGVE
jgi:hypothetical protein